MQMVPLPKTSKSSQQCRVCVNLLWSASNKAIIWVYFAVQSKRQYSPGAWCALAFLWYSRSETRHRRRRSESFPSSRQRKWEDQWYYWSNVKFASPTLHAMSLNRGNDEWPPHCSRACVYWRIIDCHWHSKWELSAGIYMGHLIVQTIVTIDCFGRTFTFPSYVFIFW